MTHRSLGLAFLLLVCPTLIQAQTKPAANCPTPDAALTASVTDYAAKLNHLASPKLLTLKESVRSNEGCYWKFHFQTVTTHSDITLYLAPDHRYLTTSLFDTTLDPLVQEKAEREQLLKTLTAVTSPSRGPKDASVTIVEFSDFECPFCQRLTNVLEKEVLPTEPDVRVVFKNFPLAMHPWARPAAQLIACAGLQSDDAFWVLQDYAFASQHDLTADNIDQKLTALADSQPKLDHKHFHDCIDRGLTVGLVQKDEELGKKLGVRATPTVYINGARVEGIRDAAQLKDLIAKARAGTLSATSTTAVETVAPRPTSVGVAGDLRSALQ